MQACLSSSTGLLSSARPPELRERFSARSQGRTVRCAIALQEPDRVAAKTEILEILQHRPSSTAYLEAALTHFLAAAPPTTDGGPLTLTLGQGTWEVFSAPHITRLSASLGTEFKPIRYILHGSKFISNVRYSSSLLREGWLSASGTLVASDANTVQVKFDRFWVDTSATSLRQELRGERSDSLADRAITLLGRLGFFPQLSYFPVLYVDSDLAVFSFPPLKSNIAVWRVE